MTVTLSCTEAGNCAATVRDEAITALDARPVSAIRAVPTRRRARLATSGA